MGVYQLWGGLLLAWLGSFRYDKCATITTSVFGNVLGFTLNFLMKSKLVSLQTVSKSIRYSVLDRFVLRRFHVLIAGSLDIREYLLGHGQDDQCIEVINNWVDFSSRSITSNSRATREKFGLDVRDIIIGCIGRMHFQKGQEFLIRAFRILKEHEPNLRLVLVGEGATLEDMRREASGMDESVLFTGSIVGDDYNNLLNMFDIYVQPSRFEGMPRTLLDAMYMKKPIVATAVNGNMDAIRDGENGILVPPEHSESIVSAIKTLLDNPKRAQNLGKVAHKDAEERFDMIRQLQSIEKISGLT